MKRILFLAFVILINSWAYAQSVLQDVVYLKNGSVVRGIIIEQVPNRSIKIETNDKSIFVFQIEEIEKITKEQSKTQSQYMDNSLAIENNKSEQKNAYKYGVGFTGSALLPMSNMSDVYDLSNGFGAKIFIKSSKSIKKESNYGISIGLLNFQSEQYSSFSSNVMPFVLFSEDYYGSGKIRFISGFETGGYNFKSKGSISGYSISDSKLKFGAGINFGILFDLSKMISLSVDVKYNYILDFKDFSNSPTWLGLNVGLVYEFGK